MQTKRTTSTTVIATVLAVVGAALTALVATGAVTPAAAATNTLTLEVTSARTEPRAFGGTGVTEGDAVNQYRFIVNVDDTGGTAQHQATGKCSPSYVAPAGQPSYPSSCEWTSINAAPDEAPIVAQGDQDTLAAGLDLPDGKYLISVLADGYKLDGAHFTMPLGDAPVPVELQPMPLPDATVKGQVFEDRAPTNGAYDAGDRPLAGFQGHLNDILGEVTTDVYGNPLCTTYVGENPITHEIPNSALDAEGLPVVDTIGGTCLSDADGVVTFPHMGTNRYTQYVTPPDGQTWIQTTTLEGNHDWDSWVMEGSTGYDTEFNLAGEAVPTPLFGFAAPLKDGQPVTGTASGHITGRVMKTLHYVPPKGGYFDLYNGFTGSKIDRPVPDAWLSLNDLQDGDQAVWTGRAGTDGRFDISGVPAGDYLLTWWDEAQNELMALENVSVANGEVVDLGVLPTTGWWTEFTGSVFNDTNRNGVRDAGEKGVPNFTLTLRKRDNSLMDRGQTTATTDATGSYSFQGYPLGEFGYTVMEAYSDSFYTTGVTYQADNQPQPTTIKGAGVDISTLNIIGLGAKVEWGVHAYDPTGTNGIDPRNGGIVGSLSYDTTRNELDPQYAAAEDWQPGVPDIPVELYSTVDCTDPATQVCDADGRYQLEADGSYKTGKLLNTYVSESWQTPTGCTARDLDGVPLVHGVDEGVLALDQETDGKCLPAFSQSVQLGTYPADQGTSDASFGATVNGNYGFGDGCFDGTLDASDPANPQCVGGTFTTLGAADYLVRVKIPDDLTGNPEYQVTSEEDINIANGNQIIPQVPPPACAGALHTVDLAGDQIDGYPALVGDGTNGAPSGVTVPASTPVDNATFLDIGGSPYEGRAKPRCDTKLVELNNGKSVVPMFNLFTQVPLPSRLRGLIIDDVKFSGDIRSTAYGEKAGVPFVPIGIYDFANRLVTTVESDYNGFYDVLLPSTDHISCPTPSGVCAGMYRFVGNDPGAPGHLNPNYNPRYRVIGTEFEAMPGVTIPTDLAPTQVGTAIGQPGTGQLDTITCPVGGSTPQLLAVTTPYVNGSGSFGIDGTGFGSTAGHVTLDGADLPVTTWTDTHLDVQVPAGTAVGPHQLEIVGANGEQTTNGLTFHVLGTGYQPTVREVGPGRQYGTIQAALDASLSSNADDLVVVYPGAQTQANPRGAYYENLIMASPVKLQGVGPGGFQGSDYVAGSILDAQGFGGDTQLATDWYTKLGTLTWDGNQDVNDGEGIYVLASENATTQAGRARQFTSGFKASIDGLDLRGGDQRGFPGNINDVTGTPTGLPPNVSTQGGAIFANAFARHLQITNNVVENNGGAYGTVRIGTPDLQGTETNQHNENVRIANNRIVTNAGTNLAGGIGIFAGADGYEVDHNDICGNYTLEYGGGLSVYGRSPGGSIHHNRIVFNEANDEGGGVMIAGALPANPDNLSDGTGAVTIRSNLVQANLSNDDGGGIRFLMAGAAQMDVVNNTIVNNVSTHEGGGISLDDAPSVRIVNNTVMKNLTTATAVTSDGRPAPAGLSTGANSDQLQATLPAGSPLFSKPVLLDNVFWDNRAGTRAGLTVTGLGSPGDAGPVEHWDLGLLDGSGQLDPVGSVVQQDPAQHPYTQDPSNSSANPQVVSSYDVGVTFASWRQNPSFVDATLVAVQGPIGDLGDYHLSDCPTSPACNLGLASSGGVSSPALDIDDQVRPALGGIDAGSDEFGSAAPAPGPQQDVLLFSTAGNGAVGGLTNLDDADVYSWDGAAFGRRFDLSAPPYNVPGTANLDGFSPIDGTQFYASFTDSVTLAGAGTVADEDVVKWNGTTWSLWFDGSTRGLGGFAQDVDAISVVGSTLYYSTGTDALPTGVSGTGDNADVYAFDGTTTTRAWDATTHGVPGGFGSNMDGLVWTDATHLLVSFSDGSTNLTGLAAVQDEDVVAYAGTTWSTYFDGSAHGLSLDAQDLDAIAVVAPGSPPPPPPPPPPGPVTLYLSTFGNGNPPGAPGTADDADLYGWDGTYYTRELDLSAAPYALPASANVDGFTRVDATHFYLSFSANTTVPGLGTVADEDVVFWNAGAWQLFFDGSTHGLGQTGQDVDAFTVAGTTLYYSTDAATNPTGVGGTADDSDVYRYDGTSTVRLWDATANGVPGGADVDGLDLVGTTWVVSFKGASTTLPNVGTVQDEDVVQRTAGTSGTWSVRFDGTAHGLTTDNLDVDAFDVP
jgi:hypothetical protein